MRSLVMALRSVSAAGRNSEFLQLRWTASRAARGRGAGSAPRFLAARPRQVQVHPGPPPRSETRTYVRDKEGMKGTIQRRREDGREEMIVYRADFDHEFPVMGTEAYDTIRLKRVDSRTGGGGSLACRSRLRNGAAGHLRRRAHADHHVSPGGPRHSSRATSRCIGRNSWRFIWAKLSTELRSR